MAGAGTPTHRLGTGSTVRALEIELYRGIVRVRAESGARAIAFDAGRLAWESFERQPGRVPAATPLSEALLETGIDGGTARISAPTVRDLVVLDVVVAARSSLRIHVIHYGDVMVREVVGDIEVEVFQGRIALEDVPGPVLAHVARDGDVRARLARSASARAMSFTTYEGDILLEVPESVARRLDTDAMQGEVRNDFPEGTQSRETTGARVRARTGRGTIHVRPLR